MKCARASGAPTVGKLLTPLFLLYWAACVPASFGGGDDDKRADGTRCDADDQCKSGTCGRNSRLCTHSFCDCPGDTCTSGGEQSPDCSPGWTCVYYESVFGDIGEVFDIDRDSDGGYCRPTCAAGCPEHYNCLDGQFCRLDTSWADPVPSIEWSGGAQGTAGGRNQKLNVPLQQGLSVQLSASAESPLDLPVQTFEWKLTFGSRRQEMQAGPEVNITLEEMISFVRAELSVRDSDYRTGLFTLTFEGCMGAGRTCGYEGSGCCNGCDKTKNTCL